MTDTTAASASETLTLPDSQHGDLTAKLTITHLLDGGEAGTMLFEAQTAAGEMVESGVLYCESEVRCDYASTMDGRRGDKSLDLDDDALVALTGAAAELVAAAGREQRRAKTEAEAEAETFTALVITAEGTCLAEVKPTDMTSPPEDDTDAWLVCRYAAYQQDTIREAGGRGLECWVVVEWLDVPEMPPSDSVPTMWPVRGSTPDPT